MSLRVLATEMGISVGGILRNGIVSPILVGSILRAPRQPCHDRIVPARVLMVPVNRAKPMP